MGLDTSYDNISEVLSLLQRYKQKIIVHISETVITLKSAFTCIYM